MTVETLAYRQASRNETMEEFRERRILRSTTLADLNPVSAGRVLAPLHVDDDLLEEMLDEHDGT